MKTGRILIACGLFGALLGCGGSGKYADALAVFDASGSKIYLLHVERRDSESTETTGDFYLNYAIAGRRWRHDCALRVIPENCVYRLEYRLFYSRSGDISAWGVPEFKFIGYSTDEELVEAKVLAYYLENSSDDQGAACKVMYDINRDGDQGSDTLRLDNELYMYGGSVVYRGEVLLHFINVAAFEELAYFVADGKKYLYFYPGWFLGPEVWDYKSLVKAWAGLGILIEFDGEGGYIIKKNLDYVGPPEFCLLPGVTAFDLLGDDEWMLLYGGGDF